MTSDFLYILLVDDDKDDLFFFQEAFKDIDSSTIVETINDGEELMRYMTKSDTVLPQIIFLELNMPRKSGLECLEEIRNNNKWNDIIIVIYSTSSSEYHIQQAFLKGANLYIKKPSDYFTLKNLLLKVNNMNWEDHIKNLNEENFLLQ